MHTLRETIFLTLWTDHKKSEKNYARKNTKKKFMHKMGRILILNQNYNSKQWNMLPDEVRDKAGTKEFIRLVRNLDF